MTVSDCLALVAGRINGTVAGCLFLFLFVYGSVVTCVIVPWLSYSVPGATNLLVLTFNTAAALICFLICVLVDPGRVPEHYEPDAEQAGPVVEVKRKDGEKRFCKKCSRHKPPRSHHCRVCQRCVLRMDHHCPWVNNCIGHGNYKAFILFLLYVNAAVLHAIGLLAAHAWHTVRMHAANRQHLIRTGPAATTAGTADGHPAASLRSTMFWALVQTISTAVTLPLAVGLVMLLVWNLYLCFQGMTTIEYHEGVTARILASRVGGRYRHPYDLGLCGNLHAILGPKPSDWCLPHAAGAHGNGLSYVTAWDAPADEAQSRLGL